MRTDYRNNIVRAGLLQEATISGFEPGAPQDRNPVPVQCRLQLARVNASTGGQRRQPELRSYSGEVIDHLLMRLAFDESKQDMGAPARKNPAEGVNKGRRSTRIVAHVEYYRGRQPSLPDNLKSPGPVGVLNAELDSSKGK